MHITKTKKILEIIGENGYNQTIEFLNNLNLIRRILEIREMSEIIYALLHIPDINIGSLKTYSIKFRDNSRDMSYQNAKRVLENENIIQKVDNPKRSVFRNLVAESDYTIDIQKEIKQKHERGQYEITDDIVPSQTDINIRSLNSLTVFYQLNDDYRDLFESMMPLLREAITYTKSEASSTTEFIDMITKWVEIHVKVKEKYKLLEEKTLRIKKEEKLDLDERKKNNKADFVEILKPFTQEAFLFIEELDNLKDNVDVVKKKFDELFKKASKKKMEFESDRQKSYVDFAKKRLMQVMGL